MREEGENIFTYFTYCRKAQRTKKMEKHINIDDVMFPGNGELVIKDHIATATIVDEEMDPVNCAFNHDRCVKLDTSDYSHLTLSIGNLYELIELLEEAEEHYDGLTKEQWDEVK